MNEPASIRKTNVPMSHPGTAAAWAWPQRHWLGAIELQEVAACSACGIVYRAWDHGLAVPVAVKEYLPAQLAARAADGRVAPLTIENAAAFERGLQAFVDEARKLAQCDQPVLVRMLHLLQAHGTAYRVMPWYAGRSLLEVRRDMAGPMNEASLRALIDNLLGGLEAFHRVGGVHGGLHPAQILLLADDRAVLLGPAAAHRALAGESAQAAIDQAFAPFEQTAPSLAAPQGPWTDFYALAQVARYCITGMMPPPMGPATVEPLAATVQRLFFDVPSVRYSDTLLRTLDAALSPDIAKRPQSVARFRERLDGVLREGVDEQEIGEPEALRLIRRAVAVVPPTAPRRRTTAPSEVDARARNAEITAERDVRTVAPPRHTLRTGSVIALLGLAALMVWHWREELVALSVDSLSSRAPAAPALPSGPLTAAAPEAATAPEIVVVPAPVPEAPPLDASKPELAQVVADRAEQAAGIPAPAPAPEPGPRPSARSEPATPRGLCGTRSNFSLYRCMQQQCSQPKWLEHPQCLHLKATDRVD
jgi:non-specific serine/threonine protein kinase